MLFCGVVCRVVGFFSAFVCFGCALWRDVVCYVSVLVVVCVCVLLLVLV